jgi:chromosome segregation ATPase
MQNHRSARPAPQPNQTQETKGDLIAFPATPSFSLGDANSIIDIEIQADQLLGYINKLTSLADRACSTAYRQTETAQLIEENRHAEINDLRNRVERQNEKLQEQQIAMMRLEQEAKAQIAALEARLGQSEIRRSSDNAVEFLRSENGRLASQLKKAEATAQQSREGLTPLEQEIAELKRQLAQRDEIIRTRTSAIKSTDVDARAKITELEQCLREARAELESHDAKLKEKDALIQATAAKEAEMGNLIKRLSAECAALSDELQEKNQAPGTKKTQPATDGTIWRRVIGRLQTDPQ